MNKSTVNGTKFGKMKKKVNNISGVLACNLNNYKPFLPQKQKQKQNNNFQSLLDAEIKRIKEEKNELDK